MRNICLLVCLLPMLYCASTASSAKTTQTEPTVSALRTVKFELKAIRMGDPKTKVESLWGEPTDVSYSGRSEVWDYWLRKVNKSDGAIEYEIQKEVPAENQRYKYSRVRLTFSAQGRLAQREDNL